jgi:threonine dehydrogenase-like Zn-dependent dehydrogenase
MSVTVEARAEHRTTQPARGSLMLTAIRAAPGDRIEPGSRIWRDPRLSVRPTAPAQVRDPFDIVVTVSHCGICGSDLSCAHAGPDGYMRFGGPARAPVVLGHEFTGRIVALGDAVTGFAPGEMITAESIWACHDCPQCRDGHFNECQGGIELLGLTVDGAFAPTVRVDARHAYSIEPLVDRLGCDRALEVGTLLEPLGNAHRGLSRARLVASDRLVVVGAGPIGLGAVALARQAGVREIVVVERSHDRRALAMALGAGFAASELGDPAAGRLWDGQGATLAVEAAGTEAALRTAAGCLGPRGRLLALGRMPESVTTDQNRFMSLGLEVIYSRGHAGYGIFPHLIDAIATGALDISPLITARFPFSKILAAFDHARSGAGGKTIVRLEEGP